MYAEKNVIERMTEAFKLKRVVIGARKRANKVKSVTSLWSWKTIDPNVCLIRSLGVEDFGGLD